MLFLSKGKENENDIMERGEKCVLQSAIEANADRKTIETVIRSGADINLKDSFGNTPMFGLTSVDQLYGFIDAEVSVEEIEQKCKFSTLNFVLNSPHKSEDVKFFLERGANVHFYKNVNDGDGSVLIRAVKSMFLEEEDVRILVEHGAYPHQTDSSGLTALQLICRKTKCLYDSALYLLERGVNPVGCLLNVIENTSNSEKKNHLVKRLLERGADPNEEDKNKQSILTVAIKHNLTEIIQELLDHRADTNFVDQNGVSPLAFAIQHDSRDNEIRVLRTLLKNPAHVLYCSFMTQINYFALSLRSSQIIPDESFPTHDRYSRKIDITGVFHLLVAGADLIIDTSLFRDLDLKCFLHYGLYELALLLMECGFSIPNTVFQLEDMDNELSFFPENTFMYEENVMFPNEEMYQVHVSKEKKSKLLTLLEKGKGEPKTLQHQCRSIIRRELSVHGQSILPLIEDLPISDIMKSFMKFEHIRTPLRETVSVDIVYRHLLFSDDEEDDPNYDTD